jgi:hypothetical protein
MGKTALPTTRRLPIDDCHPAYPYLIVHPGGQYFFWHQNPLVNEDHPRIANWQAIYRQQKQTRCFVFFKIFRNKNLKMRVTEKIQLIHVTSDESGAKPFLAVDQYGSRLFANSPETIQRQPMPYFYYMRHPDGDSDQGVCYKLVKLVSFTADPYRQAGGAPMAARS